MTAALASLASRRRRSRPTVACARARRVSSCPPASSSLSSARLPMARPAMRTRGEAEMSCEGMRREKIPESGSMSPKDRTRSSQRVREGRRGEGLTSASEANPSQLLRPSTQQRFTRQHTPDVNRVSLRALPLADDDEHRAGGPDVTRDAVECVLPRAVLRVLSRRQRVVEQEGGVERQRGVHGWRDLARADGEELEEQRELLRRREGRRGRDGRRRCAAVGGVV